MLFDYNLIIHVLLIILEIFVIKIMGEHPDLDELGLSNRTIVYSRHFLGNRASQFFT